MKSNSKQSFSKAERAGSYPPLRDCKSNMDDISSSIGTLWDVTMCIDCNRRLSILKHTNEGK